MEMQQIRYFIALSQTLHFTRAAESCNVTQPALTRAIKQLEDELGGELIRRERSSSHLTELGRRMLPFLQQCYDAALSARTLAKAVKSSDVAPLSLAVSRTVNMSNFVAPLSEMFAAYPGAQLKIRRGSGAEVSGLLREGAVELVIAGPIAGPLAGGWERLDAWSLFEESYVLAVNTGHRLARSNAVEAAQLSGETFLCLTGCEMQGEIATSLNAHGVAVANMHEVDTDSDLLALLEANAGVAFVPVSAPHSPRLQHLQVAGVATRRVVSVYVAAGRQRAPVAATLLNLLRSAEWPDIQAGPGAG